MVKVKIPKLYRSVIVQKKFGLKKRPLTVFEIFHKNFFFEKSFFFGTFKFLFKKYFLDILVLSNRSHAITFVLSMLWKNKFL